jgi:hypothetical protein
MISRYSSFMPFDKKPGARSHSARLALIMPAYLQRKWMRLIYVVRRTGGAALSIASVLYFASAGAEAVAECRYESLDQRPPLTRSDAMPVTVDFLQSQLPNSREIASRFEKEMEVAKPKVLEMAGEIQTQILDATTEAEQIDAQARQPGMLVVVDSEFMRGAKPKYNDLLLSFKDTRIEEDQLLILDPWPIEQESQTSRPDRVFVQVASSIGPEILPYLLELAAYLWHDPSLFSDPQFARYSAALSNEAADSQSLSQSTLQKRQDVIVNCLDHRI